MLLVLVVLALASYTFAAQAPTPAPGAQAQQDKAFQGTLVKVDSEAKTFTAKDADNKEMVFHYTDKTEILGSEKTVQGLTGKSGSKVNIMYKVERGANNATRIEIQ
jgi:hypothetical protein